MFVNLFVKNDKWIKENKAAFTLLDDFGVGVAVISADMEILALNKVTKKWFPEVDVDKKPICYRSFNNPPRDGQCSYCPTIKTLKDGKVHEAVTETPRPGGVVNFRVVSSPVKDKGGNIIAAIEVVEEVSESVRAAGRLDKFNKCFLNFGPDVVKNINLLTSLCGELLGATCALYNRIESGILCSIGQWQAPQGYIPSDKADGHICFDVVKQAKDEIMVVRDLMNSKYAQTDPNVMRYQLRVYMGKAVRTRKGFIGSLCAIFQKDFIPTEDDKKLMDIIASAISVEEERRLSEDALKESEDKYRKLFEDANDAIFLADAQTGKILDANRQAERLMGLPRKEMIGMDQTKLHPPEEAENYKELFESMVKNATVSNGSQSPSREGEVINVKGERIPVYISASVFEMGGKKAIQGIFRDISELKRIERDKKEAESLALIDPHTQLYNYRYLQRRIHSEFEEAKRRAAPLSLLMIDIDYFKSINDTYGHECGDVVLQEFALLLQHACREIDVVTRFEGEDFAIILPDTDGKGAYAFSERVQNVINKHRFGKYKARLMVSIGIASYPEDSTTTVDKLLTNVDKCVRAAKEKGGNSICAFSQMLHKKPADLVLDDVSEKRVKEISRKFMTLMRRNKQNTIEAVYALAHAVGAKNAYTEEHSEDMVYYATEIGKKINLSEEELEDLKHGAMLHDIGKLGISDRILLKPGKLTKKEFEAIKKHPWIGAGIIRPVHFLKNVVPIILHHHERYDGYGYGSKLKGDEIPLGARIVAIVDVYQALVSNRPYRKAYSKKEAKKIIKEEAGRHFDPKIAKVFLDILAKEKKKTMSKRPGKR